ncbi:9123_t:CDS:2, partial [Entrophospora sp. SA101]
WSNSQKAIGREHDNDKGIDASSHINIQVFSATNLFKNIMKFQPEPSVTSWFVSPLTLLKFRGLVTVYAWIAFHHSIKYVNPKQQVHLTNLRNPLIGHSVVGISYIVAFCTHKLRDLLGRRYKNIEKTNEQTADIIVTEQNAMEQNPQSPIIVK